MDISVRTASWAVAVTSICYAGLLNLGVNFPYFYQVVPTYSMISLVNLGTYWTGTKFVLACVQYAHHSKSYGANKTWVVSCLLVSGCLLIMMSMFTKMEDQIMYAYLFIILGFFVTNVSVAGNSIAVHEIRDPGKIGMILTVSGTLGISITSIFYIWLVSTRLKNYLGLAEPLMTGQTILIMLGVSLFVATIMIHLKFRQTTIQETGQNQGFWSAMRHYRVFLYPSSQYFRFSVLMLVSTFGNNFFKCAYLTQMVRGGFSQEVGVTISNMCNVLALIGVYYLQPHLKSHRKYDYLVGSITMQLLFCMTIFILGLKGVLGVLVYYAATCLNQSLMLLAIAVIAGGMVNNRFKSMYFSALVSMANLGGATSIQLWVVGKLGFGVASILGFVYSVLFVFVFAFWMKNWVLAGKDFSSFDSRQLQKLGDEPEWSED